MKERRITLRLSGREYERLLSMASEDPDCMMKKSGRASVSSYIRKRLFYSGDHPENRSLNYQVRKVGLNINQAVHWLNAGNGTTREINTIRSSQHRIEEILSQILELMQGYLPEGS